MERSRFCSAVANPCECEGRFTTLFECECNTGENRGERTYLACGRNNTMQHAADMEILSLARRVRCSQVFSKHVPHRYSHLVTCPGVTNHRSDFIDCPIERMNIADGHSLFTGAQPGLSKDSLPDPTPQGDVVKPKAQQTCVHPEQLLLIQLGNDPGALRLPLQDRLIFRNDRCVRLPIQVFRRIEDGVTFHISEYSAGIANWGTRCQRSERTAGINVIMSRIS